MKKTIKELFEIENRNPLSIAVWLKRDGFKDEHIELALTEYAEKIAQGERFGYVGGISVLSNKIKIRVKELNDRGANDIITRLGKFEVSGDSIFKKAWKIFNYKIF